MSAAKIFYIYNCGCNYDQVEKTTTTKLRQIHVLFLWSFRFVSPCFALFRLVSPCFCSGIVYSFKCNSCNAIYYSKTKRHFYVRAVEHMGISYLTNKRLKNVKQSAISHHVLTCDCNINFNDFTILSKDSNNINLLIKESLLISRDKPILNKTAKSFPLELFVV